MTKLEEKRIINDLNGLFVQNVIDSGVTAYSTMKCALDAALTVSNKYDIDIEDIALLVKYNHDRSIA